MKPEMICAARGQSGEGEIKAALLPVPFMRTVLMIVSVTKMVRMAGAFYTSNQLAEFARYEYRTWKKQS